MAKNFIFRPVTDGMTASDPSLAFSVNRGYETKDPGGQTVAATIPRLWHHMRLLCGAAAVHVESVPSGGFHLVLSGGVAKDSTTPMLAYRNADQNLQQVYKGTITSAVNSKSISHGHAVNAVKRGQSDILLGEAGENPNLVCDGLSFHVCHGLVLAVCQVRDQQSHITFSGASASAATGFVDITLTPGTAAPTPGWTTSIYNDTFPTVPIPVTFFPNPTTNTRLFRVYAGNASTPFPLSPATFSGFMPQWRPTATAICTWQEGASPTGGWTVHATGATAQLSIPRSSFFQCQGFRVLDTGPVTQAWFAFSDYVINNSLAGNSAGGIYYLLRATRADINSPWILGAMVPVLTITGSLPPAGKHAHPCYVERFGATGLRVVCPVGDSYGNNSVIALYRNDENYTAGPASDIDGQTTNGWTTRLQRHGIKTTGGNTAPAGEGNQFVGSAPYGWPGSPQGQLVGGDEIPFGILRLRPPSNSTDLFNFERLYGPTAAGINRNSFNTNYVFNCFRIECASHEMGGPFVALVGPGSQTGWVDRDDASRIVYSPDGLLWGQCFAVNNAPLTPAVFFGNRIVVGTNPQRSNQVRSIPIPAVTAQRPLLLSSGGTNLLNGPAAGPVLNSVGANNTVEAVSASQITALAGIQPPCFGPVFRIKSPAGNGTQKLGVWRLTSDVAGQLVPPASKIKVRFWVYPLPWNATSQLIAASLLLRAALGQYTNPQGQPPETSISLSREEFQVGAYPVVGDPVRGWFPVTLDTDPQALIGPSNARWRSDGSQSAQGPTAAFPLGLRLSSRVSTEPPNPCDFLIAFDCVVAGAGQQEHPGIALPATNTLSGDEQAALTGFSCQNNWTIELAAEVPDHAWDLTDTSRPFDKVLCTFWESSSLWVSVEADAINHKLRLRFSDGSTAELAAPASSFQTFSYLRSSPVLMGLRCQPDTSGSATYDLFASVGGTEVFSMKAEIRPLIKPTQIRFGDKDKLKAEAMLWYGGRIFEDEARTNMQISASLRNLDMLYIKTLPVPPGGLES